MRTAALASEYIEKSQLRRLQEMALELDRNILRSNGSGKELRQLDMEFHLFLADCSECLRLRQELSKLNIYYLKSILCEAVRVTRTEP
jgi:DNA-binding FadR family transcriptional regulator